MEKITYKGKDIEQLSRDELLLALREAMSMLRASELRCTEVIDYALRVPEQPRQLRTLWERRYGAR